MPITFLSIAMFACVAWLLLAIRVQHHTHTADDFLLARNRLPTLVGELGAAFTQIPLWLLLAIVIAAYRLGPAAAWLALAAWLSTTVASYWIAPRLRARARTHNAPTIARLLTIHTGEQLQTATRRSIALIATLCLVLAMSTQLRWLADVVAQRLELPLLEALIFCGLTLLICGLLGSLWLAAYSDAALAVLVLLLIIVIASAALYATHAANGHIVTSLWAAATSPAERAPWEQTDLDSVLSIAFGVGVMFLISSGLAQPAALSRYLAEREAAIKQRWIAMTWSAGVVMFALLIGWCARAIAVSADSPLQLLEQWLSPTWFVVTTTLLVCAGVAALLSPCIALAGLWAHDCFRSQDVALLWYRWAFVLVVMVTTWMAYRFVGDDFSPLWLAWHALGASLAPLLIVQLAGKRVRSGSALGSIWAGFILTIIFHAMPNTTGDLLERAIPFIAALGIALSGGDQRRNPDRADRGEQTVHDRLPI